MGAYDSSKTRVQPVFDELFARDRSGASWLSDLLKLPAREGPRAPLPAAAGPLTHSEPRYEYAAVPSCEYLRWMIENPTRRPLDEVWAKLADSTRQSREKLFARDPGAIEAALTALKKWPKIPSKAWWLLEGRTMVDCALFTPEMVVFIEGKRTEEGPSAGTVWAPTRNQVLRNLDCARALAAHEGRRHYFVMLVVEAGEDPRRARNHAQVLEPDTIRQSLPHLSPAQRDDVLQHYLGVTTWQEIVARFGLAPLS